MDTIIYTSGHGDNVELLNLKLNTDALGYFLTAKYRIENERSIYELDFPKIRMPVRLDHIAVERNDYDYPAVKIDLGFGYLPVIGDGGENPVYFTETVIEEKVHEMTMDELEKKLGYKVKIVNKKE